MEITEIKGVAQNRAEKIPEPKYTSAKKPSSITGDPVQANNDAPPQNIDQVASEVQIQLKRLNTELRFEVDKNSKETVVKILDSGSGEVIRQIPSKELLAIKDRMAEVIGVLFKSRA